jgi:hypothetical protein
LSGRRNSKMERTYKEKDVESKKQRESNLCPPNPVTYEPQFSANKEYILRDIYAGIELFDRLIREAKQELEAKKMYYRT